METRLKAAACRGTAAFARGRRALLVLAAAIVCGGNAGAQAQAQTPSPAAATAAALAERPDFADGVRAQAMQALWWGDFEVLRSLYWQARASSSLTAEGRQAIGVFSLGMGRVFNIGAPEVSEAFFTNLDALSARWLQQHPGDPLAVAIRARALYARGWWYRGNGMANTVSPQQFALFDRYIRQALQTLTAQAAAPDDVMSHVYFVMVARSANVEFRTQQAAAERVFALKPEAIGLWNELLFSALPKWGGDWGLVDSIIRDAAGRQTDAVRGDIMYALLWESMSHELRGRFFESRVDWARLKRGLEASLQRRESAELRNRYAYLACLRQDAETARVQLERIGRQPDFEDWGGSFDGKAAYDRCRTWLRQNP